MTGEIRGPWHQSSELHEGRDYAREKFLQTWAYGWASNTNSFYGPAPGGEPVGNMISPSGSTQTVIGGTNGHPGPSEAGWCNGVINAWVFNFGAAYTDLLSTFDRNENPGGTIPWVDLSEYGTVEYADFADIDHWKFVLYDYGRGYPDDVTLSRDITPRILVERPGFEAPVFFWSADDDIGDFTFDFYSIDPAGLAGQSGVALPFEGSPEGSEISSAAAASAGLAYGRLFKEWSYDAVKPLFDGAILEKSFGYLENQTATLTTKTGTRRDSIGFIASSSVLIANDTTTPGLSLPDWGLSSHQPDSRYETTIKRTGPTIYVVQDGIPAYVPDPVSPLNQNDAFGGANQANEMYLRAIYRPIDYRMNYLNISLWFTQQPPRDIPVITTARVGQVVRLHLDPPWDPIDGVIEDHWVINWGDGVSATYAAGTRYADHIYYLEGTRTVTATAHKGSDALVDSTVLPVTIPNTLQGATSATGARIDFGG